MKKLYCVNTQDFSPDELMVHTPINGLMSSDARHLESLLEEYRPDDKLSRNKSLLLFEKPDSIQMDRPVGVLYTVEYNKELIVNRSDVNWLFLLHTLIMSNSLGEIMHFDLKSISENYWNGVAYPHDIAQWEYRTDSVMVITKDINLDEFNVSPILSSASPEFSKPVRMERLKYAKILIESELAIEKMEGEIMAGRAKLSDVVLVNNEYTLSLIAQRMRIKQAGGNVIDRSMAIDNLQIKGDPQVQALKIQSVLDQFYPNGCILSVVPCYKGGNTSELYLKADSSCVKPAISSVNSILETEHTIVSSNFVTMDEKHQLVAGIENKFKALSLMNKHMAELQKNAVPSELTK